jgi:large subunit ribosomal protein L21
MFAVFEAKGFQYIGCPGDKMKIPRLDMEVGDEVIFDKILLIKNEDTKIGQPYVDGVAVLAEVIEHGEYDKIIVFKFKRRNRYRRKRGHNQPYTEIRIKDILLGGKKEIEKKSEEVKAKAEKKMAEKEKKIEKTAGKPKKIVEKAKKPKKKEVKTKKTVAKTDKVKKTVAKTKKTTGKVKKTRKTTSKAKKTKEKTKKPKK